MHHQVWHHQVLSCGNHNEFTYCVITSWRSWILLMSSLCWSICCSLLCCISYCSYLCVVLSISQWISPVGIISCWCFLTVPNVWALCLCLEQPKSVHVCTTRWLMDPFIVNYSLRCDHHNVPDTCIWSEYRCIQQLTYVCMLGWYYCLLD